MSDPRAPSPPEPGPSPHPEAHSSGFRRDAQGSALLGGARLADLVRQAGVPTPAYVYDLDGLGAAARALEASFGGAPHLTAYAVKANSAGSVVRTLVAAGTGADVVSGAELELALAAGVAPGSTVMSGVAKADWELDLAIEKGIFAIQAESVEELERIAARARTAGKRARVAFRINPQVQADTHAHIATGHDAAKFGIPRADVARAWGIVDARPELVVVGVSAHVGSNLKTHEPYLATARAVIEIVKARLARKPGLEYADFGGGFGIDYGTGAVPEPGTFVGVALDLLSEHGLSSLKLVIEPGRSLVGPFGVLVASVIQTKQSEKRRWIMMDAGMNDLLRPALYAARHRIEPVEREPGRDEWRVVGPVCESTDDFGDYPLGAAPAAVVIRDAGAYGFVMANEYNGRPLPAEIFVSGGKVVHVSPAANRSDWVNRRLGA
jgi:diaminopimelate decarboxylase